jgi:membrane protein
VSTTNQRNRPRPSGQKNISWKILAAYLDAAQLPLRTLFTRLGEVDVLLMASAISFSVLMTTIPVLIIFASLLGMVFHSGSVQIQQLPKILDTVFPPQPFATDIKEAVVRVVQDVVAYRTPLGIMGLLGLMVSASFVFGIVRSALHRIYRLRSTRFFLVSYLHDLFFVIVALVLLVVLNVTLWVLDFVRGYLVQRYTLDSTLLIQLERGLPTAIVVFLTALLFYILYAYLTDTRPPWPAAAASTLTSTTLWLVSGLVFGTYVQSYSLIGTIYGPYAFLLVLLLWIYYSSVVFVFGGVVGQVFWERLREHTVI